MQGVKGMAKQGIWKKEISAGWFRSLIGLLVLTATAIAIAVLYGFTVKLLQSAPVPESFRGQVELLKDYRFWLWSQWFGKNFMQIGIVLAVVFGAGIVSSEVSHKTIHFLLAKPLRRQDIFTIKYVVNMAYLLLVVLLSTIVLYIAVAAGGRSFAGIRMVEHTVIAAAGMAVMFSISAFFSTIFDQTVKSIVVSGAAALVLAVPGLFPALAKYSLYYQMAGVDIFGGKGFPWIPLAVLVVVTIGFYLFGRNRFIKTDF